MGNVVVTGSQAGTGLAIRKQLEASGRIVLGIDLPGKAVSSVFGIAVNSYATSRIGRLSNHNIEN
jgi:hypothetical protein